MKIGTGLKFLVLVGLALLLVRGNGTLRSVAGQNALSLPESRGKQIYLSGTSQSGRGILAYLGESSLEIPGSAMACANCHGRDGQGKPEGGVNPSSLNWETLTKPYGVTQANGRQHPPYTERGIELAITRGLDPAGNRLLNVMPRYQMSRDDLSDLILYLKRLGKDSDPGISENKIVIGTIVPATGALAEMGQDVKALLTAFFAEINSQGGVYNRRLELKFVETGQTTEATRTNLERFLKDEPVFAMTGAFMVGSEREIVSVMAQNEVPLVGPVTLYPQTGLPLNRQIFYLLSGIEEQARALIHFVAKKPELKNASFAIVYQQTEANEKLIEAIRNQTRKEGLSAPNEYNYTGESLDAAGIVKKIRQSNRDVVFLLGTGEQSLTFMKEGEKLGWFPSIYLPGLSAGREIFRAPSGFNGKIFFSFSTSPSDQSSDGIKEFRALAEKYKLPARHLAAQISAYGACKIFVEALKRAGKDVSREKLITTLEGLNGFDTGVTPAITYGPNRRIGALGAYVITVDLQKQQFVPVSSWIGID
jgi:ABC-type branched-subunit amino acid transport system substrate-binding protein